MNVLLLGATGKVGRAWTRLGYSEDSLQITPGPDRSTLELSDRDAVARLPGVIADAAPGLVVHTAAWTSVDDCELDEARAQRVNVDAVQVALEACRQIGSAFLFYSTDHLFAGKGPCAEDAEPAPLNVYGRTKAAAESIIRDSGVDHLIVRINVPLAPPADGASFYSFLLDHLTAGKEVRIVTDQWNNPLDTDRIARWSWEAWQRDARGCLHLGGGTYATRYDTARMVADYLGVDQERIQPIGTSALGQAARRPARGGLLISRQTDLFGSAPDLPTILKSLPKTR